MKNVGYCVHESKVVDTFTMTRWYGCRKRGGRCEKRGCKDFEREAVRRAGDGDLIRRLTICAGFHRQ